MYFGNSHRNFVVLALAALIVALPVAEAVAQEAEEAVVLEPAVDGGRAISMDVQNAEIGTVLRSLSAYSGMNIVASPNVVGKVTVTLKDVPWREALDVILRAHAFGYVEEHGVIRVDTAEELRRETVENKRTKKTVEDLESLVIGLIPLKYANADEAKDTLMQMLTQRGRIEVDERTNALLVNDIPARVEIIKATAAQLDSRTPQVEINARLVDIDRRAARDLGVSWGLTNATVPGHNIGGNIAVNNGVQNANGTLQVGTVQSYGDLLVQLDAMESENLANIISNPVITTTDNREASMLVGQKIPLIVADEAGNALVQLTTIGIMLKVTPHINGPERITLDVHNEVSDLSSQATVQGGVIINTSESDTRVVLKNGETAIIAGLIRRVESEYENGVPVLKDIPLLGGLFKQTNTIDNDRELVIFVTPRIVTDEYMTRPQLSFDTKMATDKEDGGL